jgi:hypothetical protein
MKGAFLFIGGMTLTIMLSWAIQEHNQILGYVVGVSLMFLITLLAADKIARDINE